MAAIPTLDDVARAAGVSTATVSRCLNNEEMVTAATRDKVMRAVDKLGYTPNFGARAMAAKRTYTIGAIIPTIENAIFARGLQAFQETLYDLGYTLLVASNAYQASREVELVKSLVSRGAEGILLIGYERDPAIYSYLARRNVPVLLAWACQADQPQPAVGFDNRAAMRHLATMMIADGHSTLAVISGHVAGNDRAADRLAGVFDATAAAGLDTENVTVIETSYSIESGAEAFETLMQSEPRPTLVMCGNDLIAAGALAHAKTLGIAVPDDVSITGFDDMELASVLTPPLTTVHVPHRQMGQASAEALAGMIDKDQPIGTQQLEVSVKLRGSTRRISPRTA